MAPEGARLEADGIRRTYGGVLAVEVGHLRVGPGEVVGLIGPNGAGKSSLLDALSGIAGSSTTRLVVDGVDLTGTPAHHRARAGLVRTFQLPRTLGAMTVLDNLRVAAPHPGESLRRSLLRRSWARRDLALDQEAHEVLTWLGLEAHAGELAAVLSGGERKLLELGRALMADAGVLLLDEPLAGVSPALGHRLVGRLEDLRSRGVGLVLVEHDVELVRQLSDTVICLHRGQELARGSADEVLTDPAVVDAYLGAPVSR